MDRDTHAAAWIRLRAGVHSNGQHEIRRFGHRWWVIVGEPYKLFSTLRDAKQEVESRV